MWETCLESVLQTRAEEKPSPRSDDKNLPPYTQTTSHLAGSRTAKPLSIERKHAKQHLRCCHLGRFQLNRHLHNSRSWGSGPSNCSPEQEASCASASQLQAPLVPDILNRNVVKEYTMYGTHIANTTWKAALVGSLREPGTRM